ncbi:MAG TPA: hypothetical protein VKU19_32295 [Bryobacteraceae bacterium]|nr:hypothetical protein [Bryobacteraceae bacterium]
MFHGRGIRIALLFSWLATCACHHESAGKTPARAMLFEGMGAVHHPIKTSQPEAQRFFDQGLALVYAFNFGEAINSFRQAAELDPNAAMPYWGLALANGPNYNLWLINHDREQAGFDAIQTAAGLAPDATETEREYIGALSREFSDEAKPDQPALERRYAEAMREIYHRLPDDPDAAALFAASLMNLNPWHLWTIEGKPGADTAEIAGVLEKALQRWPDHTGLNHFYVHLMEGSGQPEKALESAHRLETLAPAAGHLVHMPSHIYMRTGDYAAAVRANQEALAADQNYRRQQPSPPAGAVNYANHNQHFLAVAASMDGDFETALSAAAAVQAHGHSEAMQVMSTLVLMRFGRWEEVLHVPAPDPKMAGVSFFWHWARGCAFARTRRLKEAAAERAAMDQTFTRLPEGRAFGTFFNDWSTLHTLAVETLAARMAAGAEDGEGAIGHWRRAVAVQDEMNFDDVPDWYYPIRESLGAALLARGKAGEAEQVFREDLQRNPKNPRSLFGLWKVLEAGKKAREAEAVRQQFAAVWKGKETPRVEDY